MESVDTLLSQAFRPTFSPCKNKKRTYHHATLHGSPILGRTICSRPAVPSAGTRLASASGKSRPISHHTHDWPTSRIGCVACGVAHVGSRRSWLRRPRKSERRHIHG